MFVLLHAYFNKTYLLISKVNSQLFLYLILALIWRKSQPLNQENKLSRRQRLKVHLSLLLLFCGGMLIFYLHSVFCASSTSLVWTWTVQLSFDRNLMVKVGKLFFLVVSGNLPSLVVSDEVRSQLTFVGDL